MKIIKETDRKIVNMGGYMGVCHGCNTPLEYEDNLIVIIVKEFPDRKIVVPIDTLSCPYCSKDIATMTIYKSLEVTNEIKVR